MRMDHLPPSVFSLVASVLIVSVCAELFLSCLRLWLSAKPPRAYSLLLHGSEAFVSSARMWCDHRRCFRSYDDVCAAGGPDHRKENECLGLHERSMPTTGLSKLHKHAHR